DVDYVVHALFAVFLCILLDHASYFYFNDTATTEIYPLSLHDALPIWQGDALGSLAALKRETVPVHIERSIVLGAVVDIAIRHGRSEEHTSELQSLAYLVCRLLLEKKKILSMFLFLTL